MVTQVNTPDKIKIIDHTKAKKDQIRNRINQVHMSEINWWVINEIKYHSSKLNWIDITTYQQPSNPILFLPTPDLKTSRKTLGLYWPIRSIKSLQRVN